MTNETDANETADSSETTPTQGDPTALPGLETAVRGLFTYCPYTLIGTKAVQTIRGDTAPRPPYASNREQQLRAGIRLGYGIMLVGLFCPIFWGSYLAGMTGEELRWSAIHSGLVAFSGLLLAGWNRVQLGRVRRAGSAAEGSRRAAR